MNALLAILIAVTLAACSTNTSTRLSPDFDAYRAMAYGSIIELNHIDPDVEKNLMLRLYEVSIEDDSCFLETSGVCSNQYYLSVSTFDEHPVWSVVRLDYTGQIKDIKWLASSDIDSAVISFTLNNYTDEAVSNNPQLDVASRLVRLSIKVVGEVVLVRTDN